MAYTFIKQKGRVAILKDGNFDHQQFRSHYAFRNPEAYIAHLIEMDREAAEHRAAEAAAIRADFAARRAEREARAAAAGHQLPLI